MRYWNSLLLALALPGLALAQGAGSRIGVIDFERAVVENVDGKKAAAKLNASFVERKADFDKRQKEVEDLEGKLKTQDRALSEATRAEMTRTIEQKKKQITRLSEDAQKDLEELQSQLMAPIAEKVRNIMSVYAKEQSFTVVFDLSNPQLQGGVVYVNDVADITTEVIRRFDAEAAKSAAKPPGKN